MLNSPETRTALIQAALVFAVLFGVVLALTIFVDFSAVNLGIPLFILAFLCCLFAAKNTYDVTRANETRELLEQASQEGIGLNSEQLYAQLYKNSPVPYLIIDIDGHIESSNVAAVRLLGVKKDTVTGLNVFSRLQCDELSHLDFLVEKFRSGVSVSDEMVQVKRSDNREAWALLSLFGFTNQTTGEELGLLTLVDITKQKRAEDAKSEFVSLASHQLRTPIAGMKWSAELLKMDDPERLSERQQKYIERLLISIRRMALLVDDFLRVSRFELGTFQAEYERVNLTELFQDIMAEQAVRVEQKKLVVKEFFDETVNEVTTDPNLIRMIFTNLYTNAIKYTREQGTIHVGFGRQEDNLVITVADNGMGIPAADQDGIFSKLFRASNAVRDVPDGTGLGLYIVRQAVDVLKGNVTFTTVENMGTTFEVVVPLDASELPAAETSEAADAT